METPQLADTILLLTDGGDNSSKRSAKQLEHEFRVAGARLLTMMVYRPGVRLPPPEESARDSVQAVVISTGGSSLALDAKRSGRFRSIQTLTPDSNVEQWFIGIV